MRAARVYAPVMRAARLDAPGDVQLVDVAAPDPADDDVRVRVRWAAICGTDRKLARRGTPAPRILGHELAGETDDGTPVGVHPDIGCGRCRVCAAGMTNRCPDRQSIGIDRDGGFAEWVVVPPAQAVPVPGVPVQLAPLLEPLACCVHAVGLLPADGVEAAAVVGAGAMGLLAMWTLQARGVRVVVSQRSDRRRRMAAELGADAVVEPGEDPAAALGAPIEAVIVTAPGAEPLAWALGHVAVGGTVHAFAGSPGGAPVDANTVHYRHLTLVGSTGSTLADYRTAIELAAGGRVDLARLPRTTVDLHDVPAVLARDPDPRHVRTLVEIGGGQL